MSGHISGFSSPLSLLRCLPFCLRQEDSFPVMTSRVYCGIIHGDLCFPRHITQQLLVLVTLMLQGISIHLTSHHFLHKFTPGKALAVGAPSHTAPSQPQPADGIHHIDPLTEFCGRVHRVNLSKNMAHKTLPVVCLQCYNNAGITWLQTGSRVGRQEDKLDVGQFHVWMSPAVVYEHQNVALLGFRFAVQALKPLAGHDTSLEGVPWKHLGFAAFPLMGCVSFSHAAEQANTTVILSFKVLVPLRGLPLMTIDLFGRAR